MTPESAHARGVEEAEVVVGVVQACTANTE